MLPARGLRQRGIAAVALVLLVAIATAGFVLASHDFVAAARARAQAHSIATLAAARDALLGYAIAYPERHPGQGHGYLPCPDSGNDGSPSGACGIRGVGALGRFPYRTLGLADLRDGWGECLWYAVAGSAKSNPKPLVLNWDSPGQFDIAAANGVVVTAADAPSARAVAVVAAPGAALPTQQRAASAGARCGGATVAAGEVAAYLDGNYPATVPAPLTLYQGTADGAGNNDLLAWLTVDDIFDALRRRSDFATHIDAVLDTAATALALASRADDFADRHADMHLPAIAGGPLPDAAALGITGTAADAHDNWRDQSRFLLCLDGSACLAAALHESARLTDGIELQHCRAAIVFAGERIRDAAARQRRGTATERADLANYYEDANPVVLAGGSGQLAGGRHFAVADAARPAHEDVVRCLP